MSHSPASNHDANTSVIKLRRSSSSNLVGGTDQAASTAVLGRLSKAFSATPLCKTGNNRNLNTSMKGASTNNSNSGGSSGLKVAKSIDQHPYARGSIIEVVRGDDSFPYLCDVIDRQPMEFGSPSFFGSLSDNSWNSSDAESDASQGDQDDQHSRSFLTESDNEVASDCINRSRVTDKKNKSKNSIGAPYVHSNGPKKQVHRWRYYVHYRDSNRRLDEWVTEERIVSPPSIGAAMAKAVAAERKKAEDEHRRKFEEDRRKSIAALTESATVVVPTDTDTTAVRITRRQKRKSGGDPTVQEVTNNVVHNSVVVPGIRVIASGIDVVATVPAEELDEHAGLDESALREHEEVTKVKNVGEVELGKYRMSTWYFSPLPKDMMKNGYVDVLYVCEFTFNFYVRKEELLRFQAKSDLTRRHPPGNEIYRSGNLSMFEIDGSVQRLYCQNLCYLAKLFLDHKTLYYDVDPFLFYVLCEVDNRGFHPVGYFSKEKYSDAGFNLACILTFPSHQRKGYGRFLISFSYELSKKEEKVGSPEKPMSDLGQQAYKPYWNSVVSNLLLQQSMIDGGTANRLSVMDITKKTSIMAEDIIFTLNQLGLLKVINGAYFIAAYESTLKELVKKHPIKEPKVDATKLHWTPFQTDIKRDKYSLHNKRPSVEEEEARINCIQ